MGKTEMVIIAGLIADVLKHPKDSAQIVYAKKKVKQMCESFPLYFRN